MFKKLAILEEVTSGAMLKLCVQPREAPFGISISLSLGLTHKPNFRPPAQQLGDPPSYDLNPFLN
jgi:hypothetical protein